MTVNLTWENCLLFDSMLEWNHMYGSWPGFCFLSSIFILVGWLARRRPGRTVGIQTYRFLCCLFLIIIFHYCFYSLISPSSASSPSFFSISSKASLGLFYFFSERKKKRKKTMNLQLTWCKLPGPQVKSLQSAK